MSERSNTFFEQMRSMQPAVQEALNRANRTALLEHARMGRSVPISGTGDVAVVWLSPTEIFALYDMDEFGRPKA
jgi:hypothetical protein